VWTGSEMIIWRRGLAYQPATDSWRSIAESPLPPRNRPAIVWTGTELVVWGGCSPSDTEQCDEMNSGLLNDGARYNPDTDTWTELPTSPLIPAVHMVSGWTGSEMIIVVTDPGNRTGGTAATFDPEGLNWTLIDPPPLDSRRFAAAVWAGNQFVIWGGGNGASDKGAADGATYKPSTAEWSILPTGPGPGRALHSMIYTGDRLYISATRTASPPLQYHIDEFWPMDEASTHFDNAGPTQSVTAEVSPTQVGGVGFSFHPSTDRAEITSDRDGFIVCPAHIGGELETDGFGGSWGTRWLDGCITLDSGTVQLPATNGDQHVAIRILANDAGGREEATISMTWAPADGYLEYHPGAMQAGGSVDLILEASEVTELAASVRVAGRWELQLWSSDQLVNAVQGDADDLDIEFGELPTGQSWSLRYRNLDKAEQSPRISLDWITADT